MSCLKIAVFHPAAMNWSAIALTDNVMKLEQQ